VRISYNPENPHLYLDGIGRRERNYEWTLAGFHLLDFEHLCISLRHLNIFPSHINSVKTTTDRLDRGRRISRGHFPLSGFHTTFLHIKSHTTCLSTLSEFIPAIRSSICSHPLYTCNLESVYHLSKPSNQAKLVPPVPCPILLAARPLLNLLPPPGPTLPPLTPIGELILLSRLKLLLLLLSPFEVLLTCI
jgi:hypothetical protein